MARRSLSFGSFAVHVEVPDRVAGLAQRLLPRRRRRSRAGGGTGAPEVVVGELPAVRLERRDPQRALDFLRDPSLAGDGTAPAPALERWLAEAEAQRSRASTLAELVASYPWYHMLELPGPVLTPGSHDLRSVVELVGLPERLDGLRALDVGAFDGFWTFELERRGADVVAVDVGSTAELDWPTGAGDIVRAEGLDVALGAPFHLAASALESSVKRVECSVYDLDPATVGRFDLVVVGDLLVHLERPLAALRAIRSVTAGQLILVDRFEPSLSGRGQALVEYRGGWSGLEWWRPSLEALVQLVHDAGFEHVEARHRLQIPNQQATGHAAWDRAVIHARPGAPAPAAAAG